MTDQDDQSRAALKEEIRRQALLRAFGTASEAPKIPVLSAPLPSQKLTNRVIPSTKVAPQPTATPDGPAPPNLPPPVEVAKAIPRTAKPAMPTTPPAAPVASPDLSPFTLRPSEQPAPDMASLGASVAASSPADPLRGMLALEALQKLFPNHVFTPVSYDPYAVQPKGGTSS